jgi:hypothetical protein
MKAPIRYQYPGILLRRPGVCRHSITRHWISHYGPFGKVFTVSCDQCGEWVTARRRRWRWL